MITRLFGVILRSVGIPIVAILILQNTMLGEQGAWLAVIITLAIVNTISIIIEVIKIFPNSLFLRAGRVLTLLMSIAIEIMSVAGFIFAYTQKF